MDTPAARKPAVGFILVTLVLAIMGFGLLIPVLPRLIVEFKGGDYTSGSHYYGLLISIFALMQFIGAPILGSLSDRYGRRKIILIATAGSAIDYVIMAWAPTLIWFFIARTIAGLTAGVMSTANAYIADITPPEKRAAAFGMIGGAFGVGFIIGPALGGFLGDGPAVTHYASMVFGADLGQWLGQLGLRLPFWVAAGCSGINWLYGYFMLPESLAPENRREFDWKRANPIGALYALKRLPAVLGLAEAYFILMLAQNMMFSTWALYTDLRYHWDTSDIGLSLMYVGVLSGLVQAVLVRKLVPRLGETRSVVIGLCISSAVFIGYGLAPWGWLIYVIMTVGAFAGISGPAMQSYITKHVPPNEQGAVQGVYAGLASLAGIPGPFIATWSFGWAIDPDNRFHIPGLAFFEASALIALALVLTIRTFRKDARHAVAVPPAAPAA